MDTRWRGLRRVTGVLRRRPAPAPRPDPGAMEQQCIREVRDYLARTYPRPDSFEVMNVVRSFELERFPLPLLIAGDVADPSPTGAQASLERALTLSEGAYGDPHPLFSSSFYGFANPDVAAESFAPWLHYQVFGVREARSPHPFLDVPYMAQWLPAALRRSVIDGYLTRPALWTIDTSPYVETQRFVLESDPDLSTPPVQRVFTSPTPERWLSFKLMLIDAGSTQARSARLTAAAFLVSRHAAASAATSLASWSTRSTGILTEDGGSFTVVPGYFLGSGGACLAAIGHDVASPDMTVVRLATEFVSLSRGPTRSGDRLVFVRSALHRSSALAMLGRGESVVIAPRSADQATALSVLAEQSGLPVVVLPHGAQAHVNAAELAITDDEPPPAAAWDWAERVDPREVLFLLPPGGRSIDSTIAAALGTWVSNGSSALTLEPATLGTWLAALERPILVVHTDLLELVRGVVDDGSVRSFGSEILP